MARDKIKTLEDMSVEESQLKAERALAKEKKKLNKELEKEIEKQNIKNFEQEKKLLNKYTKERKKAEKELSEYYKNVRELSLHEYAELHNRRDKDVVDEYKKMMTKANEESITEGFDKALEKIGIKKKGDSITFDTSNLAKATDDIVKNAVNTFNNYQSRVNTRLIGYLDVSNNAFKQMVDRNTKASPYYKTTEYLANVDKLVQEGIVQNVEQRAFLETVKDELISTFDATNNTLERLVRIQNQDSTAARAGMEAYLNAFLNKTFENSEYITDQYKSTSALLEEATALLSAEQATSFEYVVQKWLGALYSEGMSSSGIQALAGAIGQLASGNINDLVGTNIGNLIAMASKGNLATYFKEGLTEATADVLMNSIVSYLQELNNSSNNVVKSQLASVFGLSISDLMAASNLNVSSVTGNNLSYGNAESYLGTLLGTAGNRMSQATMWSNALENIKFNLGANIAGNQLLYGLYEAGNLVESLLGGLTLNFAPFGVGISTSVADLLKLGALGGSMGDMIGQLLGGAKLTGTMAETYASLSGLKASSWSGAGLTGTGTSESGYVGNSDTSNVYKQSLTGMKGISESNKKTYTGKEESSDDDVDVVVPNIYKYLTTTFDAKIDTLIKLSAINSNYSVVDTMGNNLTNSMKAIMGGNSVVVQANAVEKEDLTKTISDSVVGIYDILNKVVNGELQLAVRDVSSVVGGLMNTYNMAGYNVWTGARV